MYSCENQISNDSLDSEFTVYYKNSNIILKSRNLSKQNVLFALFWLVLMRGLKIYFHHQHSGRFLQQNKHDILDIFSSLILSSLYHSINQL